MVLSFLSPPCLFLVDVYLLAKTAQSLGKFSLIMFTHVESRVCLNIMNIRKIIEILLLEFCWKIARGYPGIFKVLSLLGGQFHFSCS